MLRLYCFTLLLFVAATVENTTTAADAWIFSGQSNMQKIGSTVRTVVRELVETHGHEYVSIYAAAPGRPIEAWLDPKHRDYKLWTSIVEQVATAKNAGHTFKGFVWYQGESNVNRGAGQYQDQLSELVSRLRTLTGEPKLPVIVVQIGAATAYHGKDWATATIREAQRRFVEADSNAALVTAIDAEIGDYTVHLSKKGAEKVSRRIATVADRLAYGNDDIYLGPQFKEAFFLTEDRREVVVEFAHVRAQLTLRDGWLAGFGASVKTSLPDNLADLQDAEALGPITDDLIYPDGGIFFDEHRVLLTFADPLPAESRLSFAATRNAQYGPHRRWGLEFAGLEDVSGNHAPAFALVPIGNPKESVTAPPAVLRPKKPIQWKQIAINCIGRYPQAITQPKMVAGVEQDDWKQPYWNPASAGLVPNLFDSEGQVTGVSFRTGVWYMSPYFRELRNADDAVMASWCKHSSHGLTGLLPDGRYDLAIYLLQGKRRGKVESPPKSRAVRVSVLHMNEKRKRKDATVVLERTIDVPADGSFPGYELVKSEKDPAGNVLLLTGVPADANGRIDFAVETTEMRNGKLRWGDTTLAGIQIRRLLD